ncbi:AAA-domain-containing protein [Sphaerulina musiva SO2202]|uniref:AAA-domain-containing protein n=1 Tax=Sphaerulina musiva (strain SO2202) TaxID=692275 RepID=M3AVU1_SPHMS|nr:AAA-domain-containing protein [Sphaerulina musiva SO2202]EMF10196.1 AAA-domain-containing protein [Sphaerulina musiva SO2202]
MATGRLLKPTLHVEVLLTTCKLPASALHDTCLAIKKFVQDNYVTLRVDDDISGYEMIAYAEYVERIDIADYTGPSEPAGYHSLDEVQLDIVAYALKTAEEGRPRRRIGQPEDPDDFPQARVLPLPHVVLRNEWDSLIYDEALPSQLLRYLNRMLGVMKQPGLNLSTFNWNRLCLLHGPPGSGKSTLCRALAQKLSIRLSDTFSHAVLVEVNTNAMLSKYFGESGKLIGTLFEKIHAMAQSLTTLVCVVMDEVETIAGSREKADAGGECSDGVRATNQLLTALDRLRALPNIIVLCTSNLISAIDPAFLDRVDIKQLIPSPSPSAIYNIFRSCLNELVRSSLVNTAATTTHVEYSAAESASSSSRASEHSSNSPETDLDDRTTVLETSNIPTLAEMHIAYYDKPQAPCRRVWALSQKCEGFSGRTLRRLPILGLAMYTWGGNCTLDDAITALTAAVDQELLAKQARAV